MNDNLKEMLYLAKEKVKRDPAIASLVSSIKLCDFLSKYTLHDSYFRLVLADDAYYFTLGFNWDVFWNKEKLGLTGEHNDLWPSLFISFPTIFKINWIMFEGDTYDTVLEATSEKLNIASVEEDLRKSVIRHSKGLSENTIDLYKTSFKCLTGEIEIMHEGMVEIICINSNKDLIRIR